MKRFLIKPSKSYSGQFEIWHKEPWWNLLETDMLMIAAPGSIEHCMDYIRKYAKANYIYKYSITVRRY